MKVLILAAALVLPLLAQKGRPLRAVVCTGGGTASAATCTPSPALSALSDLSTTPRTIVLFTPTANSTGALTLAISGLAATAVKKYVGGAAQDPAADDLRASTSYWLEYDGTNFVIKTVLGNGGSGGANYTYYWDSIREQGGGRTNLFSNAGGAVAALFAGTTTASDVAGFTTSGTAAEHAGVRFYLPVTPTTWNFRIHVKAENTSTIDFTVKRNCIASGADAATPDNGVTTTLTTPTSGRYYTLTAAMTIGSCAAGNIVRVTVETSAVVTSIMALSTDFQ